MANDPMRERKPMRDDEEVGRSNEEDVIGGTDEEDYDDLDDIEDEDEDLEA